jgi:hypothetical protein
MKMGTTKKKKREKAKERKDFLSGEKSDGEEKIDKCSTGQKNPPLRKRHKKEKDYGHVSEGE